MCSRFKSAVTVSFRLWAVTVSPPWRTVTVCPAVNVRSYPVVPVVT